MDRAYPERPLYHNGLARVRYPVQCVLTALYTVFFGSLALLISLFDRGGRWVHWCASAWGGSILRTCGVEVRVEGLEEIDPSISYIFFANHHSLFDIPAMLVALPLPFRMLAKASLFKVPFMGWYMSRVGYIPVEREDPRRARRSLEEAGEKVRSGTSVLIFPEGTRSPEGVVRRFKRGGFHLAAAADIPLVPVSIRNSGRLLPRGSWHADPGVIRVRIGTPLEPGQLGSPGEISQTVREEIRNLAAVRDEAAAGSTGPPERPPFWYTAAVDGR